jgi:hypothetical protein
MNPLKAFIKAQQSSILGKKNLTYGDARRELLKSQMMVEAGELHKEGVDIEAISAPELQLLIRDRLKKKQEAGNLSMPFFDWYLEVFEPNNIQANTESASEDTATTPEASEAPETSETPDVDAADQD